MGSTELRRPASLDCTAADRNDALQDLRMLLGRQRSSLQVSHSLDGRVQGSGGMRQKPNPCRVCDFYWECSWCQNPWIHHQGPPRLACRYCGAKECPQGCVTFLQCTKMREMKTFFCSGHISCEECDKVRECGHGCEPEVDDMVIRRPVFHC